MNVLIVGGAGHVGTILRPALEPAYNCRYLDLHPVEGAEDRTVVGDVNDETAVTRAVEGQQALVYLAMGVAMQSNGQRSVSDVDAAFDVNVRGFYRVLALALQAGVQRVCLASTLSVYKRLDRVTPVDEMVPADSWEPYGLSKRVGEFLCQAASQRYPEATIVALRLMRPTNEADWPQVRFDPAKKRRLGATGPQDIRRLFLRALELDRPGCHIVQATGDITDQRLPNHRVRELLGWLPENC